MRITGVQTYIAGNPWKNWLFCRVTTDEGLTGIGEGTVNGFGHTTEAAIHEMFQLVQGMDPFDTSRLSLVLFRDFFSDGGQIQGAALSALEMACWDIKGKALGVPLYQMLGGRVQERLRVYANGWYQSAAGHRPEDFADQARAVVARGYTALKFDPFGTAWRTMQPRDFRIAVDIVQAVREAVGPDIDLLIEGHNRFSVATALQLAEAMAPAHPAWFEAPVPPYRLASLVAVAQRSPIPIAAGEDYYTREQFAALLAHDAVSIVQVEPQHMGLTAARDVVGMAQAHNAVIAPHSAQGPLCSIVCAHLNLASPNFYLHEFFDEFNAEWETRLLTGHLVQQDGYVVPPEGSGLGVDLNLEEIAQHPYHPGHFLPLFRTGWEQRRGFLPT